MAIAEKLWDGRCGRSGDTSVYTNESEGGVGHDVMKTPSTLVL